MGKRNPAAMDVACPMLSGLELARRRRRVRCGQGDAARTPAQEGAAWRQSPARHAGAWR